MNTREGKTWVGRCWNSDFDTLTLLTQRPRCTMGKLCQSELESRRGHDFVFYLCVQLRAPRGEVMSEYGVEHTHSCVERAGVGEQMASISARFLSTSVR